MDLWSLLPITLTYFVFISFWLQKVPPDNQATITLNKLRFNFPVIGPTPFKSQVLHSKDQKIYFKMLQA